MGLSLAVKSTNLGVHTVAAVNKLRRYRLLTLGEPQSLAAFLTALPHPRWHFNKLSRLGKFFNFFPVSTSLFPRPRKLAVSSLVGLGHTKGSR